MRTAWFLLALAVLGGSLARTSLAAKDITASEAELKAAYLYNFTKFITWPPDGKDDTDPFVICVAEDKDLFENLKVVQGRLANGRPILVRLLDTPGQLERCEILYFPGKSGGKWRDAVGALGRVPMLVVSDSPAGDIPAGIVFILEGRKLRFDIDLRRIQQDGIAVSSKLLKLAREVLQ